ncbi:MAG TPA: hypothetical protein VFP72_25220, partial [Kineosporiaceae bacterium]|nr:hypothetical protein [Kineosporiaceae bacterium]
MRAAAVEETLAGVSRQFQAAVARWVPGYEWFRRPATGAASSPGASTSGTGTSGQAGASGRAAGQDGRSGSQVEPGELAVRRDQFLAAVARIEGALAAAPAAVQGGQGAAAARGGGLAWTPPASWTERLAEQGLRGREFDLVPQMAEVIAAVRGVTETSLLEHPHLAVTGEVSRFLVDQLSGPVAGEVARRALEWQARRELGARLPEWGVEAYNDDATALTEREKIKWGLRASLEAVVGWADHLGSNRAATQGLTEAERAEPAQFVQSLREAAAIALTPAGSGRSGAQPRGVQRVVVAPEFDGAWAELADRVTQRRLGTAGPQYTQDALNDYVDALLNGDVEAQRRREARAAAGQRAVAGQRGAAEEQGPVRVPWPVGATDRFDSAWGPRGLSEDVLAGLAAWYGQHPGVPGETARVLQDVASGRAPLAALTLRVGLRGREFLSSGPGREAWAVQLQSNPVAVGTGGRARALVPVNAPVRLLDAGVELVLHDLIRWLATDGRQVDGQAGPVEVGPLVEVLSRTYASGLANLSSPSFPRGTVASASRSRAAFTGPGSERVWSLITDTLRAVQAGTVTPGSATGAVTWTLGITRTAMNVLLQRAAEDGFGGRDRQAGEPAGTGKRSAGRAGLDGPGTAGEESARTAKRQAVADGAGRPSRAGREAAEVADGSARRQLVDLLDRHWGRPGESAAAGERTLPSYPVFRRTEAMTALSSLLTGDRPGEQVRQDLLTALARRAGQVALDPSL